MINYLIDYSNETILPAKNYFEREKNFVLVNPEKLIRFTEKICTDENCRYPQLALRIMNHILAEMDYDNKWKISARQISKRFGVHYDTVTKCLKYLRSIELIKPEEKTYH